jgi:hypothetical protein
MGEWQCSSGRVERQVQRLELCRCQKPSSNLDSIKRFNDMIAGGTE